MWQSDLEVKTIGMFFLDDHEFLVTFSNTDFVCLMKFPKVRLAILPLQARSD